MNAVRRSQKNTVHALVRRGRPEAFLARQVPTNGRHRTAAKTDSRGWAARLWVRGQFTKKRLSHVRQPLFEY